MTPEIFTVICDRIANGESLRSICLDDGMPNRATVLRFVGRDDDARAQYMRAREMQADTIFDEILDIADDASNDWMERNGKDEGGGWELNGDHVQRTRVRIDARKWMAGKMRPKVYGDKLAIGGADDLPPVRTINVGQLSDAALAEIHAAMNASTESDAG